MEKGKEILTILQELLKMNTEKNSVLCSRKKDAMTAASE